ncbi:hypothetical protein ANCCEY_09503 [Ancylostoma ceylanicum]|uniref:Secreted protein n=1 Tax=Ancylostoma ceylanicum TaxID=53326 RepID=A0A0D6LUT2_9BILA|nr:hypothetical protein ANCCEY_09503 [Ancylostoma ceylanicum]
MFLRSLLIALLRQFTCPLPGQQPVRSVDGGSQFCTKPGQRGDCPQRALCLSSGNPPNLYICCYSAAFQRFPCTASHAFDPQTTTRSDSAAQLVSNNSNSLSAQDKAFFLPWLRNAVARCTVPCRYRCHVLKNTAANRHLEALRRSSVVPPRHRRRLVQHRILLP